MTKTKRIISLALVLVTLMSVFSVFTLNTSAKWISAKKNVKYVAYHGMEKYTFTVKTTGSWWTGNPYIEFRSYENGGRPAPAILLRVYDYSTGELKLYRFQGKYRWYSDFCLYLKKNRTYDISVCYLDNWDTNKYWAVGGMYQWTDGYWAITGSYRVNFQ